MTVKLRSGQRPGETDGYELAHRLVDEAGVSAIGFHPRSAAVHHKGTPDYDLAARLVATLDAPVILTGGLSTRAGASAPPTSAPAPPRSCSPAARWATRGCSGRCSARATTEPTRDEVLAELRLGDGPRRRAPRRRPRAARYLRKFYPWYLERLDAPKALQQAHAATADVDARRGRSSAAWTPLAAAA